MSIFCCKRSGTTGGVVRAGLEVEARSANREYVPVRSLSSAFNRVNRPRCGLFGTDKGLPGALATFVDDDEADACECCSFVREWRKPNSPSRPLLRDRCVRGSGVDGLVGNPSRSVPGLCTGEVEGDDKRVLRGIVISIQIRRRRLRAHLQALGDRSCR